MAAGSMFDKFLLASVVLQAAWATTCTAGTAATNCKEGACNVQIGGEKYCSQCYTTSEAPVDGVCTASTDSKCTKQVSPNGTCKSCAANYFLYKGGCYQIGQSPGNKICADTKASDTTGTCKACAEGYFTVSGATATVDSCVACGDENCATCTVGAEQQKCSKCKADGKMYLKKNTGSETGTCVNADGCTANNDHYTDSSSADAKECKPCSTIAGCSTCSSGTVCTKCDGGKIVKTAAGVTSCVTEKECTGAEGFFVKEGNPKTCEACGDATKGGVEGCTACAANADTPNQAKCTACTSPKKPSQDGRNCYNCDINGCMYCSANDACEVCIDGYRKNGNTCEKCTVDKCKACANDAKVCTECVEGYAPSADGSSCASSSTNKGGLSMGAIAGISVAAVVVVGGLVGFLCWWFVCRGKA